MDKIKSHVSLLVFLFISLSVGHAFAESPWDQTGVDPHKEWTIEFNTEMDEDTFKKIHVKDSLGNVVDVEVLNSAYGDKAFVKAPENGYANGEVYSLIIPNTAQSKKGIPLKNLVNMKFEIIEENENNIHEFEKEVLRLTNIEREKKGLNPLKFDLELSNIARIKSEDMLYNGYFSHNSPTYGWPWQMLVTFNVNYVTASENIASGFSKSEYVVAGWMTSPGHRANILTPEYTHLGVGFAEANINSKRYWTQIFVGR